MRSLPVTGAGTPRDISSLPRVISTANSHVPGRKMGGGAKKGAVSLEASQTGSRTGRDESTSLAHA